MRLIDGESVSVAFERGTHLVRHLEHHLNADGEVGAVEQAGFLAFRERAHVCEFVVPAGGANHHLGSAGEAGAHVLDGALGRGEVDNGVEAGDEWRRER